MKTYKLEPFFNHPKINYEENLNPQQLVVVKDATGPSLVLAGAGSGKTRVLIYRLAYLLEQGIPAQNILLVTFTNKASREMTNRAEGLLQSQLSGLWAGTFHHIGNILLRKEANFLGYRSNFTIADRDDAKSLVDDCLDGLGISKQEKFFPKPEVMLNILSLAVNSLKPIREIIATFYPQLEEFTYSIEKVMTFYEKKKKEANVMDFDDLLSNWLKILKNDAICEKYSPLFKYILVDEYQDTNRLQFEILKLLSRHHNNILAVGDDAQSIYSFRAAEINNILDFSKHFTGAKIFKLEINYRSSPQILNLANAIIKNNKNQFPKSLTAMRQDADLPAVIMTKDVYEQAKFITQKILEFNREGFPLKNIAVLFRSRFQALELEMELLKRGTPYIIRGGIRFLEQAHIKDVLSYLKITMNPFDEISFKRAVSLHKSIGRTFAYKIWEKFAAKNNFNDIAKDLPKKQQNSFIEFSKILTALKETSKPIDALKKVLEFYQNYCYVSFDNSDERIADLEELEKMAASFTTIEEFINSFSGLEDFKGEEQPSTSNLQNDYLVLSTIHQAKGLEWNMVFLIGFSDYEFPHPKNLANPKMLEEERRLFYVAATRAKASLYITYPQTKYTFKNGLIVSRASPFLYELNNDLYEEWCIE